MVISFRVQLIGYNLPAIHLTATSLDFGICMVSKSKVATFDIDNLLPCECPIVLALSNQHRSVFSLPFIQGVLEKEDSTTISILCTPTEKGIINSKLYIVVFGVQIFEIKLSVKCGNSLAIFDNELKFGPTDIYFNGASKGIILKNIDEIQSLPITAECSTNELIFNENKELILLPGEVREIPIEFKASLSGIRKESLKISAPNSPSKMIAISAFSGPEISVPVFEDVYFPPCIGGQTSYVRMPFTNIADVPVKIKIYATKDAPVKLESLEPIFVNRKNPSASVECKVFTDDKYAGLLLNILPNSTGMYIFY